MSNDDKKLKKGYVLAKCCSPESPKDSITGYSSLKNVIVVHKSGCRELKKTEFERLVALSWNEILDEKESELEVGEDFSFLEGLDFKILKHHQTLGIDYSLMVAKILKVRPEEMFEHHKKLKDLKLLERVAKVMVQYRKNIVDNKWIKHRNHTYYRITPKGERYLDFYLKKI
ncbi:MAG: hypothetical protein AMJ90_08095 [candidate division Zixibacteria bacterium SM23_73_2]|nr:MAG: hypothetical protein AMJ90_08095 [candidate division Zixibacteria bacterium SM23_73_2]